MAAAGRLDGDRLKVGELGLERAPHFQRRTDAVEHEKRWPVAADAVAHALSCGLDEPCLLFARHA